MVQANKIFLTSLIFLKYGNDWSVGLRIDSNNSKIVGLAHYYVSYESLKSFHLFYVSYTKNSLSLILRAVIKGYNYHQNDMGQPSCITDFNKYEYLSTTKSILLYVHTLL